MLWAQPVVVREDVTYDEMDPSAWKGYIMLRYPGFALERQQTRRLHAGHAATRLLRG